MSSSFEEALERYPRIILTRLPTPLQALPSLSTRLGPQVFIKRDDLTDLTLGGDKPRKLDILLQDSGDVPVLFAYSKELESHIQKREHVKCEKGNIQNVTKQSKL